MTFRTFMLSGAVLVFSAHTALAAPAEPIGAAVTVVNLVTAELQRDTRTLQSGDSVHQDEIIEVGLDAKSEIELEDETKLALGPGSRLTLDKFVYDAEKANGSIVLNLVKGTFRFVTGVAAKPSYVIRTPAASITVRGTIFDLFIEEIGLVWVLLHEGALQTCNARGQCQLLDEPGKLIRITPDGNVGSPVKWASLEGSDVVPFDNAFPFVSDAPSFDPNPILTRDVIILGNLPEPKKPTETENEKPSKKPTRSTKSPKSENKKQAKKPAKKKARTAKKGSSDDDNILSGMDIVIGVGVGGFGRGGGKHRGPRDGGKTHRPN